MLLQKFLRDESGAIVSAEMVVVATVGVLALVAGWEAVSTLVATELGDIANAVGSMNQSYSIRSVNALPHGSCSGSAFSDSRHSVSLGFSGSAASASAGIVGFSGMAATAAAEELAAVDVVDVGTEEMVSVDVVAVDAGAAEAVEVVDVDAVAATEVAQTVTATELNQALQILSRALAQAEVAAAQGQVGAAENCEHLRQENARLKALIQDLCRNANAAP